MGASRWAKQQPTPQRRDLDSNSALSQKVRAGKVGGADYFLSWFIFENYCLFIKPPRICIAAFLCSFQNPRPSTLSFMICEVVFFATQHFTFSLSLLSFLSCKCQVFGQPKSKVGRLGVALGHRGVGAGSLDSPAELSLGWSTEP